MNHRNVLNRASLATPVFAVLLVSAATSVFAQRSPVPLVNIPLVPDAVVPGSASFTLTVNGTGFVPGAAVLWNGHKRLTRFISGSQLTATILASDVAVGTTAFVTVKNPDSGGEVSNAAYFEVSAATTSVSFQLSTTSQGPGAYGVTSADFAGTGVLDLAFTEPSNPGVLLLDVSLGQGNGTFQYPVGYATKPNAHAVIAADFNGDGRIDLATADNGNVGLPGPPAVSVLLGNGDGTFQPHLDSATAEGPFALAAGDFNGDGKLDVATALYNDNTGSQVSVLLGKGNGTFYPHVEYQAGSSPNAVVVGDFNGDGKLDLVTENGDTGSGDINVLLGNGDGTFQSPVEYPAGAIPFFGLATGDFNGDGHLDLAVVSQGNDSVSILLGNGDGSFRPPASYAVGVNPTGLALGDFNADGVLDLAVVERYGVAVMLGNGDGTFGAPSKFTTGAVTLGPLTVGDFNGDGKLDMVVVDARSTASVLLQTSSQH